MQDIAVLMVVNAEEGTKKGYTRGVHVLGGGVHGGHGQQVVRGRKRSRAWHQGMGRPSRGV